MFSNKASLESNFDIFPVNKMYVSHKAMIFTFKNHSNQVSSIYDFKILAEELEIKSVSSSSFSRMMAMGKYLWMRLPGTISSLDMARWGCCRSTPWKFRVQAFLFCPLSVLAIKADGCNYKRNQNCPSEEVLFLVFTDCSLNIKLTFQDSLAPVYIL